MTGKRALVTGGGGGIGAATCRRLAAEGAKLAVCDLDIDSAGKVAAEIGARSYRMDVTDVDSVRDVVNQVESEVGPLDILVNNAGMDEFALFVDTDEEMWQRIIAVNLMGVFAVTHAVLPGMVERQSGRIVNVASEAGRVGSSGEAVYSAAKGGVIAFTKSIAREVARHKIACNAVAPGPVDTPLFHKIERDMGEGGRKIMDAMVKAVPYRRAGQPEEIAAAVAFLASDDASFITGQTLGVSGGLAMA